MSGWQKSEAARLRDVAWKMKHGISVLGKPKSAGRSIAGKIYLQSEPATPTTARADASNAEAVDSKLPKAEASSAAETFRQGNVRQGNEAGTSDSVAVHSFAKPTFPKLGLRYERS